ncbi:MAG TPA: BlaI/MecI/CopY family transcriptional regulator [Caldisericia bacterium]|nr:BlaI/MecI/CopY family transcriptional regulator [Caldisericia bacterium]HPF48327.1 BlaI/MecI/CopY family transcriptional regulator [Caldisericia bacterium]HPI83494.1 BlaI/MecI/CopY family transcriptional regulator [Caldisericia bacterium]HPQ92780.1 BlaI/MecI/CopY family transcriptional regulator [Caldisericia bacterium]HRV74122.1 BlaI/MecI/CopY family transcriptional regulator [Caldisericia bacterium]
MSKNIIRLTDNASGLGLTLGSLEIKVFESCSKLGSGTVRQILEGIEEKYAYTTVMTTCDRLAKKGILSRVKKGNCYVYSPIAPRKELDQRTTFKVLDRILGSLTEPVMEGFLDMLEDHDDKKLEALEKLIAKRKNQKKDK